MSQTTTPISGPHTRATLSIPKVMRLVMLALVPATLFSVWLFGWPALNLLLLTCGAALLAEAGALYLARKPLRPFLGDGSALLTGWLLALSLPPWAPWWIGVLGGAFAIIVGKHVFGGLGQNLFNPAMLARVMLLVSFPVQLTRWITPHPLFGSDSPGFLHSLAITFGGYTDVDAVSSATILGHVKTELTRGHGLTQSLVDHYSHLSFAFGNVGGSLGETSALFLLAGGLFLLARRIITWHAPLSMLATMALLAAILHQVDPDRFAGPLFHLLTGGAMLGAFFIITDPVTSPVTPRGQILYGIGVGLLVFVIRTWGGFPEGVGFAVLLMNAATPLIDHYLRPRIYGRDRKGEPLRYAELDEKEQQP